MALDDDASGFLIILATFLCTLPNHVIYTVACTDARTVPRLGVLMLKGCGGDVIVNCILTLFGWFPGLIHGFYVLWREWQAEERMRKHRSVYPPYQPEPRNA